MNHMEEYNYFNDHRVREGAINRGKIVEKGKSKYIVVESDEEEEGDIKLLFKWGVCNTCDGDGTHTNPSIDASGICDGDEFWEDDDDEEGNSIYSSGAYDMTCVECKGLRVTPEVDRENNNAAMVKRYDDHLEEEYNYVAELAAEKAMGA